MENTQNEANIIKRGKMVFMALKKGVITLEFIVDKKLRNFKVKYELHINESKSRVEKKLTYEETPVLIAILSVSNIILETETEEDYEELIEIYKHITSSSDYFKPAYQISRKFHKFNVNLGFANQVTKPIKFIKPKS